jgi:outer membrane protein OmpA-like peptidoglycan-associated protein
MMSRDLFKIAEEDIAMIVDLQSAAHRTATLFLVAVPWMLFSTCVPALIGCGPGKPNAKQTTAPQSSAGADSQTADNPAEDPRSQSEYEAWYNAPPAPWSEDPHLGGTNQVPLKEGLMVTTAITSSLGDYESIKTVLSVSSYGTLLYASADIPHEPSPWYKDDPPFRRVHEVVATRAEYLQHSNAYIKDFVPGQDGESAPTISFSSDLLASLKSGKETSVVWPCGDSEFQCATGPLKRLEPHPVPFPVLLRGQLVSLPAVHASCKKRWNETISTGDKDKHGQYVVSKVPPYTSCHFWILDNPDNPLVLAWEMRTDEIIMAWVVSRGGKPAPPEHLHVIQIDYLPQGFLSASLAPQGGPLAGPLGPLSGTVDNECARRAESAVEYVQRCIHGGGPGGGAGPSNDPQGASGGGSGGGGSGGGDGGSGNAGSSSGTGSAKGSGAQGANAGQAGSSGTGGSDQPANQIEQQLAEKKPVQIYGIYFDFASAIIRPESEAVLSEIADILQRNPDWTLNVDGHTDNIGGVAFNQQLSEQRAAAVKDALVTRYHIAPNRLLTRGYGLTHPVESNDTLAGRARNRRVELMRQ